MGYSAVSHEKSLYNYFIPRHIKFRRKSLAREASWEFWVVYRLIHNGFRHSDWLYFLWRGIKVDMRVKKMMIVIVAALLAFNQG